MTALEQMSYQRQVDNQEQRIKQLEDKIVYLEKSIENSAEFILEMITSMGCRMRVVELKLTQNQQ
jgi:hypothetical protein